MKPSSPQLKTAPGSNPPVDPNEGIVDDVTTDPGADSNPAVNSDEQLARDEQEAMDQSNITTEGLRHAKPRTPTGYSEPSEDDLPEDAMRSNYERYLMWRICV
ncbi:hypothetical protein PENDEC_c005G01315 [Penicillium decumbens]|uniref:Uncharacterized protein n=1 Tax=Penicillium decumbens TaxID=69771 RepID=A0A1V6PFV4_PENDC|nr:hypothetical protein PENDEC_c005G01315 [Penicillium decumbens]